MSENDMAKIARLVAFPGSPDDMMDTIAALRARVAKLEAALKKPSYNLVMKIELKIRELAIRDQQDVRVFATELANIAIASLSETVEA